MRIDYRKIFVKHNGEIPVDEYGRRYDIHHIDGNHENNDPSNLVALSIQEHYNTHHAQGDWGACYKIGMRMKLTPEELSELATQSNLKRVREGTHPWVGGELSRKRIADGTHNLLGANNPVHKLVADGTHHWFDGTKSSETQRKLVAEGKHHLLGGEIQRQGAIKALSEGRHPSQIKKSCPHCGTECSVGMFNRWHGDNCKVLKSAK